MSDARKGVTPYRATLSGIERIDYTLGHPCGDFVGFHFEDPRNRGGDVTGWGTITATTTRGRSGL